MKRFLYYFIWTLVIGYIVYLGTLWHGQIIETGRANFDLLRPQLFLALFPVAIGLLLRLPKFLLERSGRMERGFDWFKFLAVGLPSLYVVVMTFLPFTSLAIPIPAFILSSENTISTMTTIAGVVFGYVLLDSFHKTEEAASKEV